MTTPKSWQEIDRIFAAALEREPSARSAFLAEACAGDEQLRAEVESLIAHDVAESLVGGPAVGEATRLFAWLEKGYEEHSFQSQWLKVEPRWDSLRSDPRFADLIRRVGLPQ